MRIKREIKVTRKFIASVFKYLIIHFSLFCITIYLVIIIDCFNNCNKIFIVKNKQWWNTTLP